MKRKAQAEMKIRLPADLRERIEAEAHRRGCTMNAEIKRRLASFQKPYDAVIAAVRTGNAELIKIALQSFDAVGDRDNHPASGESA